MVKRAFDTDNCVEDINDANKTLNDYKLAMTNGSCIEVKLHPVSTSFASQIQLCNYVFFLITLGWNPKYG